MREPTVGSVDDHLSRFVFFGPAAGGADGFLLSAVRLADLVAASLVLDLPPLGWAGGDDIPGRPVEDAPRPPDQGTPEDERRHLALVPVCPSLTSGQWASRGAQQSGKRGPAGCAGPPGWPREPVNPLVPATGGRGTRPVDDERHPDVCLGRVWDSHRRSGSRTP